MATAIIEPPVVADVVSGPRQFQAYMRLSSKFIIQSCPGDLMDFTPYVSQLIMHCSTFVNSQVLKVKYKSIIYQVTCCFIKK